MTKHNTKASNYSISDKQYKLFDFVQEFSKFKKFGPEIGFNRRSFDKNLFKTYEDGKIYFKSLNVRCNNCKSLQVNHDGIINRKLIFLNIGEQNCLVQQF